ncbi:MAG: flagellar hook-length control protein FliK [Zymomonas mobilis]|uniref:Flagellar hook-length control protein FliK n=1 Tax=Zymomonas mobilis TaxID=542 RepID=A0A542W0J2_ZYMMB|nr:flagellar hook-length control protein FliK [Zymomonas mobilis]TQL17102.1 flagellar hook-length control protein FliK [Zymomonas mobilis]
MTDVTPILSSAGSSSTSSASGLSVGGTQKAKANPFDDLLNSVQAVSVPDAKKIIVADKKSTDSNLMTAAPLLKASKTDKTTAADTSTKTTLVVSPKDSVVSNAPAKSFVPAQKVAVQQKILSDKPTVQEDTSERDNQNDADANPVVALSDDDADYTLPSVKKLSQNSMDLLASVGVHVDQDDDSDSISGWLPETEESQTPQPAETALQQNVGYNVAFLSALKTDPETASDAKIASSDDAQASDTVNEDLSDSDDQSQISNNVADNGLIGLAAAMSASPVLASAVQATIAQQNNVNDAAMASSPITSGLKDVTSISGQADNNTSYTTAASVSNLSISPAIFNDPKMVSVDDDAVKLAETKFSLDTGSVDAARSQNTVLSTADKPVLTIKADDSKSVLTDLTSALMAKANDVKSDTTKFSDPTRQSISVAGNFADALQQGVSDNSYISVLASAVVSASVSTDMPQSLSENSEKPAAAENGPATPISVPTAAVTTPITTASANQSNAIPNIVAEVAPRLQKGDSHGKETANASLSRSEDQAQNSQQTVDSASASMASSNDFLGLNAQAIGNNNQGNAYTLASQSQVSGFSGSASASKTGSVSTISDERVSSKKDVEIESVHSDENVSSTGNNDFSTTMALAANLVSTAGKTNAENNNIALGNIVPSQDQVSVNNQLDLAHQSLWLDQLTRDIATASGSNTNLTFNLHPDHLGMLHVSMQSADNGVAVHMTASSEAAQSIIAGARHDLMNEAHSQGVHITDARIDLNSQTMSQESGQGQQANQQMAYQQRSNVADPIINNTRNEQPDDDLAEEQKNRARYA